MKPPRSILDPAFRYTPAVKTDLRATFARIRREQAKQVPTPVIPIRKAAK